jgi:uncharacterized protein (TIGR00730 family)
VNISHVGVFCGSSSDVDKKYLRTAAELGTALATNGWSTIYGGGGVGLMGALAYAVLESGGEIIGVRPHHISDIEADQAGLSELIMTDTMHERIALIFARSDAFIALPGACGTLDELMQAVTWKRLALHNKPVIILNQDGFFDALLSMFAHMVNQRFVRPAFLELYSVCCDVPETVERLRSHRPVALDPL